MKPTTSWRIASIMTALALTVAPVAQQLAEAAPIGRSSAPSVSRSSATVSRPAAAPTRIGGGQSLGVSRPDKVAKATQPAATPRPSPSYSSPAPAYTPRPAQAAPAAVMTQPQVAQAMPERSGPGWGTVAAAGLGGALLGHVLTDTHKPGGGTTVVTGGGVAAPAGAAPQVYDGAGSFAAPAAAAVPSVVAVPAAATASSGGSFWWGLLGFLLCISALAALLIGGYELMKRKLRAQVFINKPDIDMTPTEPPFNPADKFWSIQRAYNGGQTRLLHALLGPSMQEMIDSAPTVPQDIGVKGMRYEALDVVPDEQGMISVKFMFQDADGPCEQLWHFKRIDGQWKLEGIDNIR